jgi:DNA mismatch repair protein MutS
MIRQYHERKKIYGDTILLFRVGDFYELFGRDARAASKALGLSITHRHQKQTQSILNEA